MTDYPLSASPGQYREEIFRAYLFGPFRVFRGDHPLGAATKRRTKSLQLLKIFLLSGGRPLAMDELIEHCFPDVHQDKAVSNFHVAMHSLRRMLEPDLSPRASSSFLHRSNATFYRLETNGTWWTDAGEVDRLFQLARLNDERENAGLATFYYSRVAAYCVRPFLEGDAPADWLDVDRRRYTAMNIEALTRLIELHISSNEPSEAYEYSHQLVRVDPRNAIARATLELERRTGAPDGRRVA
ncbi:AfsR/SARP family transcriptional regulator [Nocardia rhizosphaerae]|uniref:Bacterial transcriptional activator domain-containing protein n=1 Tax=Nocardia rhizosphaerae TaxID=1691571 RepID=A0ABV8LAN0_9NOCA